MLSLVDGMMDGWTIRQGKAGQGRQLSLTSKKRKKKIEKYLGRISIIHFCDRIASRQPWKFTITPERGECLG